MTSKLKINNPILSSSTNDDVKIKNINYNLTSWIIYEFKNNFFTSKL